MHPVSTSALLSLLLVPGTFLHSDLSSHLERGTSFSGVFCTRSTKNQDSETRIIFSYVVLRHYGKLIMHITFSNDSFVGKEHRTPEIR